MPLSQGNDFHMHIVEGSHPKNKTIPLNQTNLGWCSGDSSCFVDRVVVFFLWKKNYESATKENASPTKQQGPKSTSQPGSTITVLQRLTG